MFSLLWLYDNGVYVLTLKFLIIVILFYQLIITILIYFTETIINNNNILKCLHIIIK